MLNIHRLDCVECTTALEVQLLAALVRERRLRLMGATKPNADFVPLTELESDERVAAGSAGVRMIQCSISRRFGFPLVDLKSCRKKAPLVVARHVAFVLCRILTSYSYPQLGRMFGNRDHTTILGAVKRMHWLETELTSELQPEDPLAMWSIRAHEKTVGSVEGPTKTLPAPQPAVA